MEQLPTRTIDRVPLIVSLTVFAVISAGVLLWNPHPVVEGSWAAREGGLIQNLSAGLWFAGSLGCLLTATVGQRERVEWLLGGIILVLFGLRELDIQKWLMDWNIGTPSNYWDPDIALQERLAVLLGLSLPATAVILVLFYRLAGRFGSALKRGLPWAWMSSSGSACCF